jgi:hypothetical protein
VLIEDSFSFRELCKNDNLNIYLDIGNIAVLSAEAIKILSRVCGDYIRRVLD